MDKLKSRSEWQAYLVTVIVLVVAAAAKQFFDVEIDQSYLWMLVASTVGYSGSRGIAKFGTNTPAPAISPTPATAAEPATDPAA